MLRTSFFFTLLLFIAVFTVHTDSKAQQIDWSDYMDYQQMSDYLETWTSNHAEIASLSTIGESYEGRALWLVTVTNPETGAHDKKPALYVQGGIDSDEVTATQSAMYLLNKVLTEYGANEEITHLVDNRTLYLLPNLIPDQSERYHHSPVRVRDSSTRPYDNDNDGIKDEDDQEDIDGDGKVLQMRVENSAGRFKQHPDDPRVMVERSSSDTEEDSPFYDLYETEGIDNDGDGLINEDPVGGVDPNRNWPAHWKQEHEQDWSGPYPLSEIENRNLIQFYFDHPNIGTIIDLHTSGNLLYRPSSVYPDEEMNLQDLNYYKEFGEVYSGLTDGPVWTPLSRRQASGGRGVYGSGIMIDWAYDHLGVFSFAPELWNFPVDENNVEITDATESEKIDWAIENLGPEVWTDWYEVEHPQLGTVELGGWNKPMPNNPVGEHVERIAGEITDWMIHVWGKLPSLQMDFDAESLGDNKYRIVAKVSNTGYMPTNVTNRALITETAKPVFFTAESSGASVISMSGAEPGTMYGKSGLLLGHIPGWKTSGVSEGTRGNAVTNYKTVELIVEKESDDAEIEILVRGQRAGNVKQVIKL